MDHFENKHCVDTPWSQRYHYKGNVACGEKDPFDRIELYPARKRYPSLTFEMPRQRYELEKVELMMQVAYQDGQMANKLAVAKMMKDLIAL